MHRPTVDIVLLLLLTVFFGIKQRRRPEILFRFWLAGWMVLSLRLVLSMVPAVSAEAARRQDALSYSLILMAGMAFLLSFVAEANRLRKTLLMGLTFGAPALAAIAAGILSRPPSWLLGTLLLTAQAAGLCAMHVLLPSAWGRQRRAIMAVWLAFGAAMPLVLHAHGAASVAIPLVAEVILSTAVLYSRAYLKRSYAGLFGALGLCAWGAFYLVPLWLPQTSRGMSIVYEFWNVPKYFIGCAMVLQIFEYARIDFVRLAEVYRALYDEFRLMYENHPHPMWIYEPVSKKLLSANVAAISSYGFTQPEMLQMRMPDLELPEDPEIEMANCLIPQTSEGRWTRHRRKDGSVVWVHVVDRATLFQGTEARFVIARDVTKQLDVSRELAHRAHHDALTGLPNRLLLEDRIQPCLDRCARDERKALLLTIDIDHFKNVNDTYGHQAGDECLKEVARRLKSKIRQVDTIARVGGEEFVAIIGGLNSAADARKVTSALLALFETPLRLSCGVVSVTVSVGGALFPDDGMDPTELQFKSDQALYGAKRAGRNRAVFASAEVSSSFYETQGRSWRTQAPEGVQVEI